MPALRSATILGRAACRRPYRFGPGPMGIDGV